MKKSTDFQSLLTAIRRWMGLENSDSRTGSRLRKGLVLLVVFHLSLFPRNQFAETSKGPEAEKVPDLDDVITPDPASSSGKSASPASAKETDPDSISDLEKAMDEGGTKGQSAPKAASASSPKGGSDPEDLGVAGKAPGGDDALGLPSENEITQAGKSGAKPDAGPAESPGSAAGARDTAGTDDLEKLTEDAPKGAPPSDVGDALELPSDLPGPTPAAVPVEPPPAVAEKIAPPAEPEPSTAPPPKESAAAPREDFPDLEAVAPAAPEPKTSPKAESIVAVKNEAPNRISNLEFKMEGLKSRVVITSEAPLRFREVRNPQVKQVVYYFENTETPDKYQRAYDTTEFNSPVALFTLLQMPKESPPLSKLIVQLREDKGPTVLPNDKGLVIEFPPSDHKNEQRLVIGDNDKGISTEENIYSGNQVFSGKPIHRLEVKNSDVQDVLRLIGRSSGYNIVIGDDVQGKVGTLSLEDIPWDQAFALVLQSKKLGYIRTGNVLRVGTLGALKSEKEEALASEQSRIKIAPLRTVLIPVSYAKATELAPQAKNFLTERGTIDVDGRTNTIILKDIEKVVTKVQKLYQALDTQPPRVSISAKFVEISETFSRDFSFNIASLTLPISGLNITNSTGFGQGGAFTSNLTAPQFANLNATLTLGETEDKVRTIANPTVSVVANQSASVNQNVSFFIQVLQQAAGGVPVVTLQQVTTNLTLTVTPIVAGDGSIFMNVQIHNDVPNISGAATTINGRDVKTQVLIENGDTAVVGGVFMNQVENDRSGMPILMHIPILGYLFSNTADTSNREELFIFLTAKIMNAEESFKRTF